MNTTLNKCPFCDSTNVTIKKSYDYKNIPYSQKAKLETQQLLCKDCGMEIDVSDDDKILEAIETTTKKSISEIIDQLKEKTDWSFAELEHALDLPERTFSRWKSNPKLSASSITLLRLIRTYPWLAAVADYEYEKEYATQAIKNAYEGITKYYGDDTPKNTIPFPRSLDSTSNNNATASSNSQTQIAETTADENYLYAETK